MKEGPVDSRVRTGHRGDNRIEAAITRHGASILERLYTPGRIVAYCESHRKKFERYAGRFAAKEAAMKALGNRLAVRRALARYRSDERTHRQTVAGAKRRRETNRRGLGANNISATITTAETSRLLKLFSKTSWRRRSLPSTSRLKYRRFVPFVGRQAAGNWEFR